MAVVTGVAGCLDYYERMMVKRAKLAYDTDGFACVCPGGDNGLNDCEKKHRVEGSVAFVPSVFGLTAAATAVQLIVGVREVRAYLRTALRRVAVRVRERRAEHAPVDVELLASEHEVVERDPELEVALARLPEDQREVLALKTEGELTFEEIGLVLGIPANTAASRYRYALEKLRAALGGTR